MLLGLLVLVAVVYYALTRLSAFWITPSYHAGSEAALMMSSDEEAALIQEDGRLDQFTLIGTHNSCHQANLLSLFVPKWRYTHHSLLEQLELGLRHIEIDLWYNYTHRVWEVWHESVDGLTSTSGQLASTLTQLCHWSITHSSHFPLWINLDIKGGYTYGTAVATPWFIGRRLDPKQSKTIEAFHLLEDIICAAWETGKLHTPQLLQGGHSSVRAALQANGWPKVSELCGHVLFMLNIYEDRALLSQVLEERIVFIRGCVEEPQASQIYFEEEQIGSAAHIVKQPYTIVRCALLAHGADKSEEMVHKAQDLFRKQRRRGVHLVASNHPTYIAPKSIYRNSKA